MSELTFFGKSVRTEAQLEKAFKDKLKSAGFLCYKFSSPAKRAVPDCLIICPNGLTVFVEFKNPVNKTTLSRLQVIEVEKMRAQNALVYVVGTGDRAEQVYDDIIAIGR